MRIETRWYADGFDGLVQRLVAPAMMRRVYADELQRLSAYAMTMASSSSSIRRGRLTPRSASG